MRLKKFNELLESFDYDDFDFEDEKDYSSDLKNWIGKLNDMRKKFGFEGVSYGIYTGDNQYSDELHDKFIAMKKVLLKNFPDFVIRKQNEWRCWGGKDCERIELVKGAFYIELVFSGVSLRFRYGSGTYFLSDCVNGNIKWDMIGSDYNYVIDDDYDYDSIECYGVMDQEIITVEKGEYLFKINIVDDNNYSISGVKPRTKEEAEQLLDNIKDRCDYLSDVLDNITVDEMMNGRGLGR